MRHKTRYAPRPKKARTLLTVVAGVALAASLAASAPGCGDDETQQNRPDMPLKLDLSLPNMDITNPAVHD